MDVQRHKPNTVYFEVRLLEINMTIINFVYLIGMGLMLLEVPKHEKQKLHDLSNSEYCLN